MNGKWKNSDLNLPEWRAMENMLGSTQVQGPGSPLRGVVIGASGRERDVGLMPWRSQTYQDPQGVD